MDWFLNHLDIWGAVAAAVVSIVTAHKKVVKPLAARTRQRWLEAIRDIVRGELAELHPNGGGSIKDQVNRIERMVAKSHAIARAHMNNDLSRMFFETDPNGRAVFTNRAYLDFVGRTPAEMASEGWVTSLHPEDREAVYDAWTSAVSQRRVFDLSFRMIDRDHRPVLVRCIAYPLFNETLTLLGYLGTVSPEPVNI